MNRTILIIALSTLAVLQTLAQKPFNPIPKSGYHNNQVLQATDTLYGTFFAGTPALYQGQNVLPGYASGNNAFGDLAKAQVFSIDTITAVTGAIVWMGYKSYTSGDVNSKVNFNIYDLKPSATGQGALALKLRPDSIIRTTQVGVLDLDTSTVFENGANVVLFNPPAYFDSLFAIGFDFKDLYIGDTIACYTNTNGDADSTENAWEQSADSSWGTMLRNWTLNVDFAIFPIIDDTQTGVHSQSYTTTQFTIYPNPANSVVNITLQSRFDKPYYITLLNSEGKTLENKQLSMQTETLDISLLPKGIYYCVIRNAGNKGYAKKLIVD